MKWYFEKFKGDMAIYAFCPKCGFEHTVSYIDFDMSIKIDPDKIYNYCPICGIKDETNHYEVNRHDIVWNQRSSSILGEMFYDD